MLSVQKEITMAFMLRTPQLEENVLDFFIVYDTLHVPHLLLPTTKGFLPDHQLYAMSFDRAANNPYHFTLSQNILPFSLENAAMIHDQLGFFFGPDHNMLTCFLRSETYKAYVSWCKETVKKLIHDTLLDLNQTRDVNQIAQYKDRLTLLLQA